MKAAILREIGSAPILDEIDRPTEMDGKTLIKVRAAALNRRDYWITRGMYPGIQLPMTLGSDLCGLTSDDQEVIVNPGLYWGEYQAVQSDRFEVLGMPSHGSFAEYCSVPEENVFPKPAHLNSQQAAALPLGGVTAYRALFTRGAIKKNDKVLITGAGGGVSSFCLLFALAIGAVVYVTSSSPEKINKSVDLGARSGFLYNQEGYEKELLAETGGIDLIIDSAGGPHLSRLVKCLNPGGRVVFYGGTTGKIPELNPQLIFWRQISIMGSTMGSPNDFAAMLALVNKYKIVPIIDEVFPISDIKVALEKMGASLQYGKIVLDLSS